MPPFLAKISFMARPLRIEFPGAIYHVTSGGDRRESIFDDDEDRQSFLTIVGRAMARFDAAVLAYCLMDNRYHLVVHVRAARGGISTLSSCASVGKTKNVLPTLQRVADRPISCEAHFGATSIPVIRCASYRLHASTVPGVGCVHARLHSAFAPDSFTTFAHLSISFLM